MYIRDVCWRRKFSSLFSAFTSKLDKRDAKGSFSSYRYNATWEPLINSLKVVYIYPRCYLPKLNWFVIGLEFTIRKSHLLKLFNLSVIGSRRGITRSVASRIFGHLFTVKIVSNYHSGHHNRQMHSRNLIYAFSVSVFFVSHLPMIL